MPCRLPCTAHAVLRWIRFSVSLSDSNVPVETSALRTWSIRSTATSTPAGKGAPPGPLSWTYWNPL